MRAMKVSELIEALQKLPQDLPVMSYGEYAYGPVSAPAVERLYRDEFGHLQDRGPSGDHPDDVKVVVV